MPTKELERFNEVLAFSNDLYKYAQGIVTPQNNFQ